MSRLSKDAKVEKRTGKRVNKKVSICWNYFNPNACGNAHDAQMINFSESGMYFESDYFSKTKGINNNIRLGRLRDNISTAEPVLRNTDVLSFDIGAIKYAEAPGSSNISPNGLHSEEACQLAKYAGMSDRLKVFGLFEYDTGKDELNVTAKLLAQIVWYFIEGFLNRQNKKPDENDRNIMYRVEVKDLEIPFVFYKNPDSNQWWMQIIFAEKVLHFACSEKEYNQASNNEIPELWVKYIMKLDKMNTNN